MKIVAELRERERKLISLRYDKALSMEEIENCQHVSRMVIAKRLRPLHRKMNHTAS